MPPKRRGRAKAPAKAKQRAKKQPAKQAAKKPAKEAPKEDDVRSNRCFLITSKDSVKIQLADASDGSDNYETTGPMGLLENARLFSRDDEWQKELQRSDEVILRHRSCSPYSYMSRRDAVHYAASRLIERVQTYGRLVLQLPGEYVQENPGGMHPIQRDIATTEPKTRNSQGLVDTVHEWTRTYTYTDSEGSCECEAKFTTTVTSLVEAWFSWSPRRTSSNRPTTLARTRSPTASIESINIFV